MDLIQYCLSELSLEDDSPVNLEAVLSHMQLVANIVSILAFELFNASQSLFRTKFINGRLFLSFYGAVAMN